VNNAPQTRLAQVIGTIERIRHELDYPRTSLGRDGDVVGPPKAVLNNVRLILENDPGFAGRFAFCAFRNIILWSPTIGGAPTEAFTDHSADALRVELATHWRLHIGRDVALEAAGYVARLHSHHAVRAHLEALPPWDGVERLDRLLTGYFGARDCHLYRAIGAAWMVSAVARVMASPTKVDTVLILRGTQGCGKSTFAKVLGGAWHKDTPLSIGDKDSYLSLRGAWIYELCELAATRKKDVEAVKAFLTSEIDSVRLPYERMQTDLPRQCVFVGTTNESTFLNDPTGARRFWPVTVGRLDFTGFIRDRDQLWAEALYRYREAEGRPEAWLLPQGLEAELALAHEEVTTLDPWERQVDAYLDREGGIDVFRHAGLELAHIANFMDVPVKDRTHHMENRLGAILRARGWEKTRRRNAFGRHYVWMPPAVGGAQDDS
jgi:putative DNA primase/helicase